MDLQMIISQIEKSYNCKLSAEKAEEISKIAYKKF